MKKIEESIQLDFDDVLIQPKISNMNSRSEVILYRTFGYGNYKVIKQGNEQGHKKWDHYITCIPITCANMATVGNVECVKQLVCNGYIGTLDKHVSYEDIVLLYDWIWKNANHSSIISEQIRKRVSVSIGIKESLRTIRMLSRDPFTRPDIVTVDVPNGYCPDFIKRIKQVRDLLPNSFIIAGNVVTPERVIDILQAGADCAKIGLGSSGVCLTRAKTGVGRPQLSTIIDCSDTAHHLNKYVMSDGGCKVVGDICKAFCADSDFVMTGSLFSGCDESEGDIITLNGKKYKEYYGMSSKLAQERHFGGFKSNVRASEGREKLVPYKGPIKDIIEDINGGLRSCCTYIGSSCIKNMGKHATFYKVNRQLNTMYELCPDINS